jgi:hypothetical protein
MRKTLIAMSSAAAVAVGTFAVPQQAEAHVWWWIPAAIVGGAVVGATVAAPAYAYPRGEYYGYAPSAAVYAGEPRCTIVRERVRGGFRRVEVCD